jgi:DNA-binding PadR family transcriptional regulator
MSLKHAILGFLSSNPHTGYDLKKAFDQSVRHFWPANQSQIYRTLAELDEQGLVEKEVIPRQDRLDMKLYRITEAGRAELQRWLATPLPAQDYREAVLIQVYFGGKLADEELIRLLNREIQSLEERLATYEAIYASNRALIHTVEDQRAFVLMVSTLEYGILSNRAAVNWLKSVLERVRSGHYVLQNL